MGIGAVSVAVFLLPLETSPHLEEPPFKSSNWPKTWLRVTNMYPKWKPGEWKHGPKPAVHILVA